MNFIASALVILLFGVLLEKIPSKYQYYWGFMCAMLSNILYRLPL